MKFGAQLFSLRDFIKTKEGIDETFRKVKDMGYECVQFSGASYVADELAELSAKHDLPVVLTHIPIDRLAKEVDEVIAEHRIFNCHNIGIGSLPYEYWYLPEKYPEFAAMVKPILEKVNAAGMKLFYHNHDFDFVKMDDGRVGYDYLADELPKLNFTLDTYWVQRGGGAVLEYIEKFTGRMECVHLKDQRMIKPTDERKDVNQRFAPLGQGTLNFDAIIPALQKAQVSYALVEQDDAVTYDDPFGQLKISADYLIKKGYIK